MTKDEFDERFLGKGRELYEAGDKSELLNCLRYCVEGSRPIPDWLRSAFLDATHLVDSYQVRSWDDVFGRPVKKGRGDRRLAYERHKYTITLGVWETVRIGTTPASRLTTIRLLRQRSRLAWKC
jgi:hypothetical protein